MIKVLHIGKYYPPFMGGIEIYLADLLPALEKHSISCKALVHAHEFISPFTNISDVNKIYRVPSYGRLLYAPVSPHFPIWLDKIINEFKPEILHIHMPNTSAFWLLLSKKARKIPWVIHWHSDVISTYNKYLNFAYNFYKPFEQKLLKLSQAIIVTSPPYLTSSLALKSWQHKSHIIPLGIDITRLPLANTKNKLWAENIWGKQTTLRIFTIGRMSYYKGHEILIRAAKKLENIQIVIVGNGEERRNLENLIKILNIQNKVKLLGFRSNEEIAALFNSCDCFCLPSLERTEAFGVVLMEAMRYSKPIIASDIYGSGVTWVVKHKENGFLFPVADIDSLVNILQKMQNFSLQTRQQIGKNGFNDFKQRFQIDNVALQISELYNGLLI
jgi:rhamnosyl/mannosyltransferase